MRAEALQVLALGGVAGVVPVADVDEVDAVWGQAASGPAGGSGPRRRAASL
jgi:hypothetical protein